MSSPVSEKYIYHCFSYICTVAECKFIVVRQELTRNCRELNTGPVNEIIVCMFQAHGRHLTNRVLDPKQRSYPLTYLTQSICIGSRSTRQLSSNKLTQLCQQWIVFPFTLPLVWHFFEHWPQQFFLPSGKFHRKSPHFLLVIAAPKVSAALQW